MEKLDQITKDTCVEKILALRNSYVDEFHEHCRVCNEPCERYKPISRTQINFRQGALAIYNSWYQNISIRGLPTE